MSLDVVFKLISDNCPVLENIAIPTPWMVTRNSEGVVGGGGAQRPNFLKKNMKLITGVSSCRGLWGGGVVFKQKNHLWGPADYGYFLELHNLTLTSGTLSSVV